MSCGLDSKRHCAHCLKEISGKSIKKCGKCLKRAYCSKDCQTSDWSPKQDGQGHKNWCGIDCGEEDIDWAVMPIAGKGLGVVALRDIPKAYPIIVEANVDKTHPGVAELTPLNGSLDEKYDLNKYTLCRGEASDEVEEVLCLRMSRVNHSCAPNADHFYDKRVKVNILISLRDIKKGEEICISYLGFDDLNQTVTPEMSRIILQMKWGIVCSKKCLCFNHAYHENAKQGKEMYKEIFRLGLSGKMTEALGAAHKCFLESEGELNLSVINVKRTLEDGFRITVMDMSSVARIVEFLTQAFEELAIYPELNGRSKKSKERFISMWRVRVNPRRTCMFWAH